MKRKEDHPLQKVTLNLFDGDFEKLRTWHDRLGAGKVVRELVRAYIRDNEEKFNQIATPTTQLNLDLENLT